MENLNHLAIVFGIGVAIGGSIVGIVSAYIGAYHRTRGARRELASKATKAAMETILKESRNSKEVIRLQAELYSFYFNVIKKFRGKEFRRWLHRKAYATDR